MSAGLGWGRSDVLQRVHQLVEALEEFLALTGREIGIPHLLPDSPYLMSQLFHLLRSRIVGERRVRGMGCMRGMRRLGRLRRRCGPRTINLFHLPIQFNLNVSVQSSLRPQKLRQAFPDDLPDLFQVVQFFQADHTDLHLLPAFQIRVNRLHIVLQIAIQHPAGDSEFIESRLFLVQFLKQVFGDGFDLLQMFADAIVLTNGDAAASIQASGQAGVFGELYRFPQQSADAAHLQMVWFRASHRVSPLQRSGAGEAVPCRDAAAI